MGLKSACCFSSCTRLWPSPHHGPLCYGHAAASSRPLCGFSTVSCRGRQAYLTQPNCNMHQHDGETGQLPVADVWMRVLMDGRVRVSTISSCPVPLTSRARVGAAGDCPREHSSDAKGGRLPDHICGRFLQPRRPPEEEHAAARRPGRHGAADWDQGASAASCGRRHAHCRQGRGAVAPVRRPPCGGAA